jgi:hypothetical protein
MADSLHKFFSRIVEKLNARRLVDAANARGVFSTGAVVPAPRGGIRAVRADSAGPLVD